MSGERYRKLALELLTTHFKAQFPTEVAVVVAAESGIVTADLPTPSTSDPDLYQRGFRPFDNRVPSMQFWIDDDETVSQRENIIRCAGNAAIIFRSTPDLDKAEDVAESYLTAMRQVVDKGPRLGGLGTVNCLHVGASPIDIFEDNSSTKHIRILRLEITVITP